MCLSRTTALMCVKSKYPMNLFMLFAFTATMSYTIGIVCTAYASLGLMVVVVEAFALTSLLWIQLCVRERMACYLLHHALLPSIFWF